MSNWKFGDIVGMDYIPDLRLMMVGTTLTTGLATAWWALVLDDEIESESAWKPGTLISVPADGKNGPVLIERAKEL